MQLRCPLDPFASDEAAYKRDWRGSRDFWTRESRERVEINVVYRSDDGFE